MEVSGVVFRTHSHYPSSKTSSSAVSVDYGVPIMLRRSCSRDSRVSVRPRKLSGFYDDGHVEYYSASTSSSIRCGGGKKENEKETVLKKKKKKLKLLKGLSRDLSTISNRDFGLDNESDHGLVDEVKGTMISEAAELLLAQLQKLRAEEKESKKNRKEEKAKLKAARMQNKLNYDTSLLKTGALAQPQPLQLTQEGNKTELQAVIQETTVSVVPSILAQEQDTTEKGGLAICSSKNFNKECSTGTSSVNKIIEVCMGGKCRKSGGTALLEEFQKVVGVEGGVVGCKCMGKCRDGPNVKVLIQADDFIRTPYNPLYIGVGLEDVGLIVANFFGQNHKNTSLAASS